MILVVNGLDYDQDVDRSEHVIVLLPDHAGKTC